nr:DUF2510 domain-containing protein [Actinomycetota bacterium]
MARAESVVEKGWYPDPAGRYALRWYDGTSWTEHVVHDSRRTTDPQGAPADGHSPPRGHDARWLPPPSLPDGPRWGPFAIGVPSYGSAAVPEDGYEPVLTGNRALDLTQDYVNEFESQLRRDASLVRSSVAELRRTPSLKWLGTLLAVLVVVLFAALLGAVVVAGGDAFFGDEPTDGTGFLLVFVLVPLLALALAALYSTASVVSFSAAVAAGIASSRGERPGAWGLLRRVLGAAGAVGALALARFAGWRPNAALKAGGALYEAFAVFVVPVAVDENVSVGAAQRRSEELVAARWGPGRFRALGLPQTSPWSVVYSSGVTRYGYKAPFLSAAAFVVALLGPLLVAVAVGNTTAILVTFGWMWGSLV